MCKSYVRGWLCTYQFTVIFRVFFQTNNESWGVTHCCLKSNWHTTVFEFTERSLEVMAENLTSIYDADIR